MNYKHYIKTDNDNFIIDSFSCWQKEKFDGTEIEVKESNDRHYHLEIYDSNSYLKLKWNGSVISEASQNNIESSTDFITRYKLKRKDELFAYIEANLLDVTKTLGQIRTQWASFKADSVNWTTKADVDNAYDTAVNWLHS